MSNSLISKHCEQYLDENNQDDLKLLLAQLVLLIYLAAVAYTIKSGQHKWLTATGTTVVAGGVYAVVGTCLFFGYVIPKIVDQHGPYMWRAMTMSKDAPYGLPYSKISERGLCQRERLEQVAFVGAEAICITNLVAITAVGISVVSMFKNKHPKIPAPLVLDVAENLLPAEEDDTMKLN